MNLVLRKGGYPSVGFFSDAQYTEVVNEAFTQNDVGIFENYLGEVICKTTQLRKDPTFQNGLLLEQHIEDCKGEAMTAILNESPSDVYYGLDQKCQKDFEALILRYFTAPLLEKDRDNGNTNEDL